MELFVFVCEARQLARRARRYDGGSNGSQSSQGRHCVSNKVQEALPGDRDSYPVDIGGSSLMQGKDRSERHVVMGVVR